MIQIAICDDSDADRRTLKRMLECYFARNSQPFDIEEYDNGTVLADDYADGIMSYQLIFLDIFLQDSHGISIAKIIREFDTDVKIIFFTTSIDFAIESYEVSAFYYLVKPVNEMNLCDVIDRFFLCFHQNPSQSLLVKSGHQTERLLYSEILYIESKNSFVIIHAKNGKQFRLYLKLSELQKILPHVPFLRCHQSYIVNLNYIRSVNRVFVMMDGTELPIRRQDMKKIKDQYFDYVIRTTL